MDRVFIATANGLISYEVVGHAWQELARTLGEYHVTCVSAQAGILLAGTVSGIFASYDAGESWCDVTDGMTIRHLRWIAHHNIYPDLVYAGTEPADIFVSTDGGRTWQERSQVTALRDWFGWYLPYSPEAGCVRGFAAHGARVYAAVEQGGVLRSNDEGRTWYLAPGSTGQPVFGAPPAPYVQSDVHSIAVHPSSPDLVFAATGRGLYRSSDGGLVWEHLYECYCRAVWVDPANPAHLVFGPAEGVDKNGRIEETDDGGQTWHPVSQGLDVPWPGHMVERFSQLGQGLIAVLSNGQLIAASLHDLAWHRILPDVKDAEAVFVEEG